MKQFRIFIENLPKTASETEIKSKFSNFGDAVSVEIKERKVVTTKHTSCFFAYVNLRTSDEKLQQCFQTFSQTDWHGQHVKLQIAKESFLERLRREREAKTQNINPEIVTTFPNEITPPSKLYPAQRTIKESISNQDKEFKITSRCGKQNLCSSDSSDHEEITQKNKIETSMLEVKRPRKEATIIDGLLKIKDFGKNPIGKASLNDEKVLDERQAESEAKRKKAVQEKIRAYHNQKKKFDIFKTRPKIIKFTDSGNIEKKETNETRKKSKKVDLFDSSDSETEEFDIEKCIENKIKSDERFTLDERFTEKQENEEVCDGNLNEEENNLKILEEVLGKKIKNKSNGKKEKTYIRYDPENPSHQKYVMNKKEETESRKKKKTINEKAAEAKEAPEVSSERAFTKDVDFKSLLGKSNSFSLSGIFNDEKTTLEKEESIAEAIPIPQTNSQYENPFKYDSSDDEDLKEENKPPQIQRSRKVWTEPLFLQENDFRYQEGMDFVKRIGTLKREEGQIVEERRKFIQIVRNKIRNVNKKNKRFKKKLGGSKKKKIKKIDNALKR